MKNYKYVPTSLEGYLNESKTFTLKRGYAGQRPVVVGSKGNIRDQVLPFIAENKRIASSDLKRFIAGLNETSKDPVAAANMWIKRNSSYFVTESKGGVTYYSLSKLGKRLVSRVNPMLESKKVDEEGDHDFVDKKKGYDRPGLYDMSEEEDCDTKEKGVKESENAGQPIKQSAIEKYLASKKARMFKKSQWENLLEEEDEDEEKKLEESEKRKARIKKLLEGINSKRKINEAEEEEKEEGNSEEDELTFDDLDLGDGEDAEDGESDDLDLDSEEGDAEVETDDVEIAEFILTVDDAEAAIKELKERGIEAEISTEEDGEEGDDLGLDGDEEGEEEMDLDLGDDKEGEGDDMDLDLDVEGEKEVEESSDDMSLTEADDDLDLDIDFDEKEGEDDLDLDAEGEEGEEGDDLDLDADGEEEAPVEGAKIKVKAEYAKELVKWLEEKGVDVEEMFGGEIEFGDDEDDEEGDDEEEGEEGEENEEGEEGEENEEEEEEEDKE